MMRNRSKVYVPDREMHLGFFPLWYEMVEDLVRSRELVWRFFLRDFSVRYKQTALGILWAVIMPLVFVVTFVFLNKGGILNVGPIGIPYAVYVLFGISVWAIFSTGLSSTSNSMVKSVALIVQINFPKVSLVMAAMGEALVECFIKLGLLAIVCGLYHAVPHWHAVFLPLTLFPLFLFTVGLGFVLSLASGVMRDIPNMVVLINSLLMFVCPVLYPMPRSGIMGTLNEWNPLSHLISASRDIVFLGTITNMKGFIISSLFSILVFLIGWRFFYIAQTKIPERI